MSPVPQEMQMSEENGRSYDRWLWGKKDPFCSLSQHMIAVGACVSEYLMARSNHGLLDQLCAWMGLSADSVICTFSYVAALHDIGKAHPSFQRFDGEESECYRVQNFRHEQYGEMVLNRLWVRQGWSRRGAAFFASIIRLHHQGKGTCELNGGLPEKWAAIHESLEGRMRALFRPEEALPPFQNLDALGVCLSAVLIISDWIASSRDFEGERFAEADDPELLQRMRERANALLRGYRLVSDESDAYPRMQRFTELWPAISPEAMRPLQRISEIIADDRAMLTIIEAPMGEGKTETALYLAGRLCERFDKKGIYMALPTAATSNQMVGRVREMLGIHRSGETRLMHSMAWLIDEQTPTKSQFDSEDAQSVEDWLRPLRRGMLSENAVGTVDQAMAAATRIKYGFLRLAGLEQKVLIIDEIHAYDLFMSTIIARLLEWCRALEVPVIMLSATLQNSQKQYYMKRYGVTNWEADSAYPLITQVMADGHVRQSPVPGTHMRYTLHIQTERLGGDVAMIGDLVQARARNGGCICVMMNTVRQAQEVYRALKARGEAEGSRSTELMLFHARFTAKRRAEIEQRCLSLFGRNGVRPERMILVCTQVVEQSLDVDFDGMITQLAPMDLLLQRAGRVHRHGGRKRPAGMEQPTLDVLLPEETAAEDLEKRYLSFGGIYPPEVMKNTEDLLNERDTVLIPGDVRECVERAYRDIEGEKLESIIRRQLETQMRISDAEGELLPSPKSQRFLGQTPNIAASLEMDDASEGLFLKGAKTRDGSASQRFAFLPADFPEGDMDREWLRAAMEYSCNCPLPRAAVQAMLANKTAEEKECEKMGCIMLRPDAQGLYHWRNMVFTCSDEYGIEVTCT